MMHLKKTKYFFPVLLIFCLLGFIANAQKPTRLQQQFDKAYNDYRIQDYETAIIELDKILKKNPEYTDAILLLADVYHDAKLTDKEIESLEDALQYSQNALIFFRLGKANQSIGNYEKALLSYEAYLKTDGISEPRKNEVIRNIAGCRFAIDAKKHPVEFNPERLSENINTTDDEYWPSVSLDGSEMVFTRLVKPLMGRPQEDFYISVLDSAGWEAARPIEEINSKENEGAQSLSADGKLLFFTACNRSDGYGSCDIYYSLFDGKLWSKPRNAGNVINSGSWEGQPTISSDNRYLYFSSGRAGGKGNKDIWRAQLLEIRENGTLSWASPENIGEPVNTEGDEISPFIHPNNKTFYFASDYHTGMGKLDLFQSNIEPDNNLSEPHNLGYPINTSGNEQGLNISADGRTAFYASERVPGYGLDIYTFQLPEGLRPEPVTYIKAKITDAETGAVIMAEVDLLSLSGDSAVERKEKADVNGEILLCLPLGSNYAFNVSEPGYLFYSKAFILDDVKTADSPFLAEIKLNKIKEGAEMNLYNIYFETDSFRILSPSKPELEKLTQLLKLNPGIEIEVQGHTDNTGGSAHNLALSENRAKAVADYLISNGIISARLKYRGYGETLPVADNKTEEGRMLNRRTTVKIKKK